LLFGELEIHQLPFCLSDLILRSAASWRRVLRLSKDEGWQQARPSKWPSFETRASFDKLRSALLRMRSELGHCLLLKV